MPKSISVIAIAADDDCTIIVTNAPTTINSKIVKNEFCGTCASMPATISPIPMAVATS